MTAWDFLNQNIGWVVLIAIIAIDAWGSKK